MPIAIKARTTISRDILSLRMVQIDEKAEVKVEVEIEVEVEIASASALTLAFYVSLFTISLNTLPRCS